MCENNLEWTNFIGVSTDSSRSMSGCYGRFQALIRKTLLMHWGSTA